MSQRGLPASFWQLPQPGLNGHHNHLGTPVTSSSAAAYADLYSDQLQQAAALHQLAAEWQYPSAAHSAQTSYAAASRSATHPYNYSRFHQPASAAAGSYWASRLAAGQVKGEWAPSDYQAAAAAAALQGATGLHNAAGDFSHHYGAAAAHHYSNMTGNLLSFLSLIQLLDTIILTPLEDRSRTFCGKIDQDNCGRGKSSVETETEFTVTIVWHSLKSVGLSDAFHARARCSWKPIISL